MITALMSRYRAGEMSKADYFASLLRIKNENAAAADGGGGAHSSTYRTPTTSSSAKLIEKRHGENPKPQQHEQQAFNPPSRAKLRQEVVEEERRNKKERREDSPHDGRREKYDDMNDGWDDMVNFSPGPPQWHHPSSSSSNDRIHPSERRPEKNEDDGRKLAASTTAYAKTGIRDLDLYDDDMGDDMDIVEYRDDRNRDRERDRDRVRVRVRVRDRDRREERERRHRERHELVTSSKKDNMGTSDSSSMGTSGKGQVRRRAHALAQLGTKGTGSCHGCRDRKCEACFSAVYERERLMRERTIKKIEEAAAIKQRRQAHENGGAGGGSDRYYKSGHSTPLTPATSLSPVRERRKQADNTDSRLLLSSPDVFPPHSGRKTPTSVSQGRRTPLHSGRLTPLHSGRSGFTLPMSRGSRRREEEFYPLDDVASSYMETILREDSRGNNTPGSVEAFRYKSGKGPVGPQDIWNQAEFNDDDDAYDVGEMDGGYWQEGQSSRDFVQPSEYGHTSKRPMNMHLCLDSLDAYGDSPPQHQGMRGQRVQHQGQHQGIMGAPHRPRPSMTPKSAVLRMDAGARGKGHRTGGDHHRIYRSYDQPSLPAAQQAQQYLNKDLQSGKPGWNWRDGLMGQGGYGGRVGTPSEANSYLSTQRRYCMDVDGSESWSPEKSRRITVPGSDAENLAGRVSGFLHRNVAWKKHRDAKLQQQRIQQEARELQMSNKIVDDGRRREIIEQMKMSMDQTDDIDLFQPEGAARRSELARRPNPIPKRTPQRTVDRLFQSNNAINRHSYNVAVDLRDRRHEEKELEACTFEPNVRKSQKSQQSVLASNHSSYLFPHSIIKRSNSMPTLRGPPDREKQECTFVPRVNAPKKSMNSCTEYLKTSVFDRLQWTRDTHNKEEKPSQDISNASLPTQSGRTSSSGDTFVNFLTRQNEADMRRAARLNEVDEKLYSNRRIPEMDSRSRRLSLRMRNMKAPSVNRVEDTRQQQFGFAPKINRRSQVRRMRGPVSMHADHRKKMRKTEGLREAAVEKPPSFTPTVTTRAQASSGRVQWQKNTSTYVQQYAEVIEQKTRIADEKRAEQEMEDMRECTFHPNTKRASERQRSSGEFTFAPSPGQSHNGGSAVHGQSLGNSSRPSLKGSRGGSLSASYAGASTPTYNNKNNPGSSSGIYRSLSDARLLHQRQRLSAQYVHHAHHDSIVRAHHHEAHKEQQERHLEVAKQVTEGQIEEERFLNQLAAAAAHSTSTPEFPIDPIPRNNLSGYIRGGNKSYHKTNDTNTTQEEEDEGEEEVLEEDDDDFLVPLEVVPDGFYAH